MKKNFKRRIKNKIKGELNDFLKDESGVMSKENILKIGVGGAMVLGALGGVHSAKGQHVTVTCDDGCCCSHNNVVWLSQRSAGSNCVKFIANHWHATWASY